MERIPGYTHYYINDEGVVWSALTNRILQGNVDKRGYIRYKLKLGNKSKLEYAHRLVLLTYRPIPDPEGHHVRHIDGDTFNNSLDNLAWVDSKSYSYNTAYTRLTPKAKLYIEENQLDKPKELAAALNLPIHLVYKQLRHIRAQEVRYYKGMKITRICGD